VLHAIPEQELVELVEEGRESLEEDLPIHRNWLAVLTTELKRVRELGPACEATAR
jgi:hypothetical protein